VARLRVLTWHVHGGYLESLGQTGLELILPVAPGGEPGYGGRADLPLPAWVREVPAEHVKDVQLDAILFQSPRNLHEDQFRILTPAQRSLPRAYLEHDPPREHPVDARHHVHDPSIAIVHVTAFNALMWDNGDSPVRVIDHGIPDPGVPWDGGAPRGIAVINELERRGRRAGADLFLAARQELPIDLVGLASERVGGLGAIPHAALPRFLSHHRFFFHPARYTSLGLAVIEAMLVGLPVVAPATTELVTVIEDGRSGIISTDPGRLHAGMRALLDDVELARRLGAEGRRVARARFGMDRFAADWQAFFRDLVAGTLRPGQPIDAGADRRRVA
jgi:hypothetical protein